MNNKWWLVLVISLPFLAPVHAEQPNDEDLVRIVKGLPQELVEFAGRAEGCYIWSHEAADGDEKRSEEIRRAFVKMQCVNITSDKKELDVKYKGDAAAVKALAYIAKNFMY